MTTRPKAANGEGRPRKVLDKDGGFSHWEIQFTLKDGNGKTLRRPLLRGATQKEVTDKRDKLKREALANKGMRTKTLTAAQIVDEWMDATARNKEASTLDAYERAYRNHIAKNFNFKADQCDGDRVDLILRTKVIPAILQTPGATTGRSMAKRVYDMVNAAMTWASAGNRRIITPNPMLGSKFTGYGKVTRRLDIRIDDARAIVAASHGKESELIWRLLLGTGARRGEILGLDVRHVDLRKREILIEQIATPESGGHQVSKRTKGKEVRTVPIPKDCATMLADRIKGRRGDAPVFPGPQTHRLGFATLRSWFLRDMENAGVCDYTIHQFRHTFATHALVIGTPVNVVASILGHANVNITWNTYGHVLLGSKNTAVDDVASAIALPVATNIATTSTTRPSIPATARDMGGEAA